LVVHKNGIVAYYSIEKSIKFLIKSLISGGGIGQMIRFWKTADGLEE
jgi:hypothetical protein